MGRYLDLLKQAEIARAASLQNQQNPLKSGFVGFEGLPSPGIEENQAADDGCTAVPLCTANHAWLLHFLDRDPLEVWFAPPASHAQVLAEYPEAVAAEPLAPTICQPLVPMSADEEKAVRAWLALIGETDPATVSEVIGECQRDAGARAYAIGRAAGTQPGPDPCPDDLRTCNQCANLAGRRCQAAKRGEIAASRNHEPIRDLPRRCEGYAPGPNDPDRRLGRERWPGLVRGQAQPMQDTDEGAER